MNLAKLTFTAVLEIVMLIPEGATLEINDAMKEEFAKDLKEQFEQDLKEGAAMAVKSVIVNQLEVLEV